MANFIDGDVQALLHQAEERLDGNSTLPKHSRQTVHALNQLQAAQGMPIAPLQVLPSQRLSARAPDSERKSYNSKKDTAGLSWFDLPKTDLTPEFRRDWQLLRMRDVLDPKHQKKTLRSGPPKYSQVGEIMEGPVDLFGARLSRKDRKRTIIEHLMTKRDDLKLKSKYDVIQQNKMSGKRAFYQKLVSERRKKRS